MSAWLFGDVLQQPDTQQGFISIKGLTEPNLSITFQEVMFGISVDPVFDI